MKRSNHRETNAGARVVASVLFFIFLSFNTVGLGAPVASNRSVYVITETRRHESFDPLQADKSQNLAVMRMLYATPIEVSERDELASTVLERFHYDPKVRQIEWVVRDGLQFADGSPLTSEDIALSVARMVQSRPGFPVIQAIEGRSAWLAMNEPLKTLPSGIRVDGRKITITFESPQAHPLFRFALELFSIIPSRCVDLSTGKMTCERPAESGPYKLESSTETGIDFISRGTVPAVPKAIRFVYRKPSEIAQAFPSLEPGTVVAGREDTYRREDLQRLQAASTYRSLQKCRFADMDINPKIVPFETRACRAIFAADFRSAAFEILAADGDIVEGSIFTKLMPGYLSIDAMSSLTPRVSETETAQCRARLRAVKIRWAANDGPNNDVLVKTLEKLAEPRFGYVLERVPVSESEPSWKLFAQGRVAVTGGSSGFWAIDPLGDLQMLFTPNLHEDLQFVALDAGLQEMISAAVADEDAAAGSTRAKSLNQYIFDQALFNVYRHTKRFYAFPKGTDPELLQIGVEAPYPWRVFAPAQR